MSLKKYISTAALAGGVILAPLKGKANIETNAIPNVSTVAKAEKASMPEWIPTTPDGDFDEKGAKMQANILWKEHGKPIQKFADDVKAGVPEEVAFAKFAHQLAKGDKEKEKLFLSLSESVKKARKEMDGDMRVSAGKKALGCAQVFLLSLLLMGLVARDTKRNSKAEAIVIAVGMLGTIGLTASSIVACNIDKFENLFQKETFVKIQRAMYDTYKQSDSNFDQQQKDAKKAYTIVDMSTARKMVEMQQAKR